MNSFCNLSYVVYILLFRIRASLSSTCFHTWILSTVSWRDRAFWSRPNSAERSSKHNEQLWSKQLQIWAWKEIIIDSNSDSVNVTLCVIVYYLIVYVYVLRYRLCFCLVVCLFVSSSLSLPCFWWNKDQYYSLCSLELSSASSNLTT